MWAGFSIPHPSVDPESDPTGGVRSAPVKILSQNDKDFRRSIGTVDVVAATLPVF